MEQIKQSFDFLTKKIENDNNLLYDNQFIKNIVELTIHSNEKYLCEPDIINHRAFIILRDYFLHLLQRWRCGDIFNNITCSIFESISNLFLKLSSHISDKNLNTLKSLIIHDSLLNEANQFLDELSTSGKYLEDPQIKSMDNLLRAFQRLERVNFDNKKDNLFDSIVKCICSPIFIDIFLQSINQETDDIGQRFLLNTCTDYIYSHSTDQEHKQSLIDIRQSLLRPFTQWLIQQSTLFRMWNNRMLISLRQICFLLTLSIQLNPLIILDKETLDCYCEIIDSFINILYSITHPSETSCKQDLGIFELLSKILPRSLSNNPFHFVK